MRNDISEFLRGLAFLYFAATFTITLLISGSDSYARDTFCGWSPQKPITVIIKVAFYPAEKLSCFLSWDFTETNEELK